MPWPCFMIEPTDRARQTLRRYTSIRAGAVCDDRCLVVKTPGGDWVIDGPARDGGRWTRTGTPPLVTARPSILTPTYHGWLTDGVLSDDLDGRTYPVVEARPADQAGGAVESSQPHD